MGVLFDVYSNGKYCLKTEAQN